MKKLLIALVVLVSVPAIAGEWALVDSSGTVVQVVEAEYAVVQDYLGPNYVNTFGRKVGIGWKYNVFPSSTSFTAPISTATIVCSHPEIEGFCP